MQNICTSIIAIQFILGGIQACVPAGGPEILKTGSITLPEHFIERVIDTVAEIPITLIIDHINSIFFS